MISKPTARIFKYLGALSPVFLAGFQMHGLIVGTRPALTTVPGALALLLGAVAILAEKKAGSAILAAYMLAMYYGGGEAKVPLPAEMFIFCGLALGLLGVFTLRGRGEHGHGAQTLSSLTTGLALSFTRISGAAGLSFGALLWMFSMAEMSDFTVFNSVDGVLVMLFGWQTLKRQSWAAGGQVVLAASNLALSYAVPDSPMSVFGFFPLFLLLIHALGFIGVANLKNGRRQEDRRG